MPVVSKNQNAAMHAAAQGQSTLGIPQSVGQKFVNASHGMNVKALPQAVAKTPPKKKGKKMRRHSEHWS